MKLCKHVSESRRSDREAVTTVTMDKLEGTVMTRRVVTQIYGVYYPLGLRWGEAEN